MVSPPDSRGLGPGRGLCCVLGQQTKLSQHLSPHRTRKWKYSRGCLIKFQYTLNLEKKILCTVACYNNCNFRSLLCETWKCNNSVCYET